MTAAAATTFALVWKMTTNRFVWRRQKPRIEDDDEAAAPSRGDNDDRSKDGDDAFPNSNRFSTGKARTAG